MFNVRDIQHTPDYTAGIQSRDTNTESIKRLALSILATVATYFLCPRPVFLITTGISLIINLPLAQTMSSELFRVFQNIVVVPLQRQPRVEGTIHNGGGRARDPIFPEQRRDRPEPGYKTGSTTENGAVGQRAVTTIRSSRPLAPTAVRVAQPLILRSEQWGAPLRADYTFRQAPQASHGPGPSTGGLARGNVTQARMARSSFDQWVSPQRETSEFERELQADSLAPPQSRTVQGAVGSRAAVTVPNLIPPPDAQRRSWPDEEEHKENRAPYMPGHVVIGSGQGR